MVRRADDVDDGRKLGQWPRRGQNSRAADTGRAHCGWWLVGIFGTPLPWRALHGVGDGGKQDRVFRAGPQTRCGTVSARPTGTG